MYQKMLLRIILLIFTLFCFTSCIKELALDPSKDIKEVRIKATYDSSFPAELSQAYDKSFKNAVEEHNNHYPVIRFALTDSAENLTIRYDQVRFASGARRLANLVLLGTSAAVIVSTGLLSYLPVPVVFIPKSKLTTRLNGDSNFQKGKKASSYFLYVSHGYFSDIQKQQVKHLKKHGESIKDQLKKLEYQYLISGKKATRSEILNRFSVKQKTLYFISGFYQNNPDVKINNFRSIPGSVFTWGLGINNQFSKNLSWILEGSLKYGREFGLSNSYYSNGQAIEQTINYYRLSLSGFAGGIFSPLGIKTRPYLEAGFLPSVALENYYILNNARSGLNGYLNTNPFQLNVSGGLGMLFVSSPNTSLRLGLRYARPLISYLKEHEVKLNSLQFYITTGIYIR